MPIRLLIAGALSVALALSAAQAQTVAAGDWPSYGRDQAGTRYSPLDRITPANVAQLQPAWTYHMNPDRAAKSLRFSTTTPIVVGGRMFLGTPYGRIVALDPTSGRELWAYTLDDNDQPAYRGPGYWPGDTRHPARLIVGTLKGRIIALDAATGRPAAGFGTNGIVDSKTPDVMNGYPNGLYSYSAPPAIYRNIAIFGSRLQERPNKGPRGDVHAWDVISGKPLWTFHSIPRQGERFRDTWDGASAEGRSGANAWNMITVDAARGIAYLAFGAPAFDRYGGDRKGANLFSSSLVAVNATTGKYLWHFQATHHDIWDYDLDTPPTLLTVRKGGKIIPAVAVMNKSALLFLLDRVTGKPIFGVTERQVPPSSVASEQAWPTQPFPDKPGILTRMSFDLSEVADTTPEHRALCQALIDKEGMVGSVMYEPLRADRISIRFPGGAGGPEWGGGAFDAARGLFVFGVNQVGYAEKLVPGADGNWTMVGGRFVDPKTHTPCQKPPWGELIAIDVNSGEVAWRSTLGVTDYFPEGKRDTGRPSNGGPIATAGGLIFIGGTDDQRFRAFETRTGKELWAYKLDYSAHATPITYLGSDGRQFVATIATGGSFLNSPIGGDSLIAFALPQ